MSKELESRIRQFVEEPKANEIEEILDTFRLKIFGKGMLFKEPYTISEEMGFLSKGSVRMFITRKNGDEASVRVFQKNQLFVDIFSLENSEITAIGFECLEDCEILVASMKNLTPLLETNLTLNIFLRKHMSKQILEIGEFYFAFITSTGKERYQMILEKRPELMRKFPLRIISSLIGVTPTQLSRIRSKK